MNNFTSLKEPLPKSLVTGGAGFIGSHVIDELVKLGHHVVCVDDLSGGFQDNINPSSTFIRGSIVDSDLINSIFKQHKFDYVFHFAAYAAEGLSHFIKRFNYTNNLIGSVNLINASVNAETVKCFIFTSSIAVYGENQLPMVEDTVPSPEDPYGIAKYAVELDLKQAWRMFNLPYIIFRPHNVYGERQNIGDKYRNVVGIFMNQIQQEKPMTIFGDGEQKRAFSYIGDVAPIIARSIERKQAYNQVFNIGADLPYTVNELARLVAKAFNVPPQIKYLDERAEVKYAYSSHDKIKSYFSDLIENIPLEQGIEKMSAWVKSNGTKTSAQFKNIEVRKNMPASWS